MYRTYVRKTAVPKMLIRLALGLVLAGQMTIRTNAKNSPPPKDNQAATIESIFQQMVQAAQRKDDAALAKFQAPTATYIDASHFSRGYQEYRDKAQIRGVGGNAGHAQLDNYRVTAVETHTAGSVGWVTYEYALTAPVDGKPTPIVGWATIIFKKFGQTWKVVHSQTAGRPMRDSDTNF